MNQIKQHGSFTFPIIGETTVGAVGVVPATHVFRKGKSAFISEDAVFSPISYWQIGLLKVQRIAPGKGSNAFVIDGKHAIIVPFIQAYQRTSDWSLRRKGYIGPIDLHLEYITENNWWESCTVETLITSLINTFHKRNLPDWFEPVKSYIIKRITVDKVLRFNELIGLLPQVAGIKSLEPVTEAVRFGLKEELTRYKQVFTVTDDTVEKMISSMYEIPDEKNFANELLAQTTGRSHQVGFRIPEAAGIMNNRSEQ